MGYHCYRGLPAQIYIVLAWLDCLLVIIPKWWLCDRLQRVDTLIIDRYLFDIAADVILSTDKPRQTLRLFDPLLRRHMSSSACIFLACQAAVVTERRPDIVWDRSYPLKARIYRTLRRLYGVPTVDTSHALPEDSVKYAIRQCES